MNIWYTVTETNEGYGPLEEYIPLTLGAWERIVEHCAEDYSAYRGGWERTWPLTFSVRVARFHVHRVLQFTAYRVK